MKKEKIMSWVVYLMTLHGKEVGVIAVCSQDEWDAMELVRPGYHTLIQNGFTSEGDAERLARGRLPPDPVHRRSREGVLAQASGTPKAP